MNILAIDYGQRNIGLAWAQLGLDIVLPFGVVKHDNSATVPTDLVERIKEERIEKIIIGLPFDDSGNETPHTKRIRAFAEELKAQSSLPIDFADERYSSAEADDMGGEASRDEKAAMVILKEWLSRHG